MSEWREVSLRDCNFLHIIDGDRGTNYPKAEDFFDMGHCLFLNTKNVTQRGFSFESKKYISEEKDEILRNGKLQRYDIVMTTRGTIGNVAFYGDSVKEEHIRINSGMVIFRTDARELLPEYLYYCMISPSMKDQIKVSITGTAQPQLPISTIVKLRLTIPPLETQKRISEILSALDGKIEVNNKMNRLLEELAETIFHEWFINFNFKNSEGKPYKKSGGKMVESELGDIPEGWRVILVSDFFNVAIGKTPPRNKHECFSTDDKNIKWLSISDMGKNGIYIINTSEYLTEEAINKYNVSMVPKNTVMLSFKLTVGRVSISSEEMTTNEAIAHFKTDSKNINEYLYFYLKNLDYYSLGSTSSIAEAVNSKIIKSIKFLMPDDTVLNNYHSIADSIFQKIKLNQIENNKLAELRDTLLPKLMSGELKV